MIRPRSTLSIFPRKSRAPVVFANAAACNLIASVAFLVASVSTSPAQEAVGTETSAAAPFTTTTSPSTAPSTSQTTTTTESTTSSVETDSTTNTNVQNVPVAEGGEISAEPRRFAYELRLTVRGVYDDNINISNTDKISDYYFAIEPAITVGFGDITGGLDNYIRLDYMPSILFFADHSENDAVQHLIHLGGQHRFGHLNLVLGEDIAILDGTDIGTTTDASTPGSHVNLDVGGRTRVDTFSTRLNASYDLTGKTFLSSGFISSVTEYPGAGLISSEVFSGNLFINFRYSDKLNVGLGGTAGYHLADAPTPDQSFEQANARASYVITGKINLNASGGVEFRQFENESRGQYVSPVFELGMSYHPFDGTNFSLTGSRRTYNSAVLGGQDFAGTTITASLRQRLFQRLYLGLSGGYQNSDYFSTVDTLPPASPTGTPTPVVATRRDNYFFVQPTIDLTVTRFWTVGAYYLHRENDSSDTSFQFSDNQVGVRTTLNF